MYEQIMGNPQALTYFQLLFTHGLHFLLMMMWLPLILYILFLKVLSKYV